MKPTYDRFLSLWLDLPNQGRFAQESHLPMTNHTPNQWFKLEEKFFNEVDQKLVEKLRTQMETAERAEAIKKVTGIVDDQLVKELAEKNITVETLSAFRLVPHVAVAWADDRLESDERDAVMQAAKLSGISADEPAGKLLSGWLANRPPVDLFETWIEYARSLSASLDGPARSQLKHEMVGQVRAVAEAAGGILGMGSTSPNEKAVIKQVEQALS